MKPSFLTTLALSALLLAGCGTPTKVEHGAIRAKTFSFVDPGSKAAPAFADNRQQVHAAIQNAVTRNLADKGLTRVPAGGDLTVAYLIIVGNNGSTEAISTYFGYGRDTAELHDKAQKAYTSNKNPNYFEAGTLLIDVIDGQNYKLIERNYATRPLLRDATAEVRAERIQEVVDEALKGLQIVR